MLEVATLRLFYIVSKVNRKIIAHRLSSVDSQWVGQQSVHLKCVSGLIPSDDSIHALN